MLQNLKPQEELWVPGAEKKDAKANLGWLEPGLNMVEAPEVLEKLRAPRNAGNKEINNQLIQFQYVFEQVR